MANTAAILNILVTANTKQANAALATTQTQLKATQAQAVKSSAGMGAAVAKGAKVGGLAIAALGAMSIKAAADWEDAFAGVRKTVNATEGEFDKMEKGLRGLAKTMPITATEVADLAAEAGALGIKAKDIVKFTKVAAMLGEATDMSANDAANGLARLSNVMGTSSKDFERLGSTLVALGNKGASTEAEILSMSQRMAGAAKIIGLTESEVLAMGSALASVGIRAEMGGSAISKVWLTIDDAIAKGGAELQSFADIAGMSEKKFTKLFSENANAAVIKYATGLKEAHDQGQSVSSMLETVELNEIRVRETLLKASAAHTILTKAQEQGNRAWEKNNALNQEAQTRFNTIASQAEILRNRIQDLFIAMGQKLEPATRAVLEVFNRLAVGKLPKFLQDIIDKSAPLRAAIGHVGNVFSKVFDGISNAVQGMVRIVKGAFNIIAGILTGDWRRAWEGVKEIARGAIQGVIGIVKTLTAPVRAVAETVFKVFKAALGGIKTVVTTVVDKALGAISTIFDEMSKAADLLSKLPLGLGDAWDDVQTTLENARDSIDGLREKVRGSNESIKQSYKNTGQSVNAAVGGMARDVDRSTKEAANKGTKNAGDLRKGVVGNVKGLADGVNKGLSNVVDNTNKALKGFGVKKQTYVAFEAQRADLPQAKQRGGVIKALRGTLVPGRGNGDKVPALLEPGEVVVNKRAVAAAGGAGRVNKINRMIPRFATGGVAEPPGDPGSEVVQAAYAREVGAFLKKFNMDLSQGYNPGGPSVSPGHLSLDAAPSLDVVPLDGNWDGLFAKGLQWALSQGMQVGYDGQYGTQSWHDHGEGNHAHIDWKSGGKLGGAIAKIKDMVLKGPAGPLLDMGQKALDKSVAGANEMLSRMAPGPDSMGIGTYKGPLDKVFPATSLASPGVQLSPAQVKSVMRPAGLPSVFSGIAVDESGNHPGIIGYDPGGTRGLGLWQITTGFNDDIIRKYGGETQMRNPVRNALAAAAIFARQPSAWAASGNAMQQGGIVGMQNGGIVQKMQGGGVAGQGGENPQTPVYEWFKQMYDQPLVGRMKEIVGNINLSPKKYEGFSGSYSKALDYSELGTVAMGGDYTAPDGTETWGSVNGHVAIGGLGADAGTGWLDMQLVELLQLRDRMLAAVPIVRGLTEFVKDKIKKLTGKNGLAKEAEKIHREAERVYNRLKSDVESLQQQIAALEKIQKPTNEQKERLQQKRGQLHDVVNELGVAKQKLDDAKFRVKAVSDVAGAFTAKEGGLTEVMAALKTGGAEDGSWPSLEALQGRTGKAGEIFDVTTEIAGALRAYGESTASIPSGGTTPDTSGAAQMAADLGAAEIKDLQDALRLSQAQYGVFAQLGMQRGGVVPALAAGGKIASGGWALVGEQGPELTHLPTGAQVYPNSESQTMMEPQPVNVRVFIGDQELTDIVRVETDNRLTRLTSHATARGGVPGRKAGR